MLGFLFGMLSSASFGLSVTTTRRGVLTGTIIQGLYMSIILGVPLFALSATIFGQLPKGFNIPFNQYLLLAAAGILHFVGGRYCNYRALRAIGATRLSTISSIQLPYTVATAIIFLGEQLNLLMGLGILLIFIGPAIIYERANKSSSGNFRSVNRIENTHDLTNTSKPGMKSSQMIFLHQAEGYIFGTLGALAYGTSPLFIRAALDGNGLAIFGGLVSYSAAAIIMLLLLSVPANRNTVRNTSKSTFLWFSGSTISVFFAQLFRFVALSISPVTIVATLQRTHVLFVLLFSFLINRQLESFSPKILVGISLSAIGAILLGLGKYQ